MASGGGVDGNGSSGRLADATHELDYVAVHSHTPNSFDLLQRAVSRTYVGYVVRTSVMHPYVLICEFKTQAFMLLSPYF